MSTSKSDETELIAISEIFGPTIQGEGAMIGTPTVFVRTGGCDYRCSWCDTGYAVLPEYETQWTGMQPTEIMDNIESLTGGNACWITLSGGNPATQPLTQLIQLGHEKGYQFSMETQGSVAKDWFVQLDQLTLSPKPPSTNMQFKRKGLDRCLEACDGQVEVSLKFVVADKQDLLWSQQVAAEYPDLPVFVQPCNTDARLKQVSQDYSTQSIDAQCNQTQRERMLWLISEMQAMQWNHARVLPQLHVWLWGSQAGV